MHQDYSASASLTVVQSPIPRDDTGDFDMATKASAGAANVAHLGFRDVSVFVSQSHPTEEVWARQTDLQGYR